MYLHTLARNLLLLQAATKRLKYKTYMYNYPKWMAD